MNLKHKIGLTAWALCISVDVLAQPGPGYQVGWGSQGVPLSPWANAVIALMLAFAAYAFLRKRAGRALMMLAGAVLVGGLSVLAQDRAMAGGFTDLISTPAGSMTLYCSSTHWVGTTVGGGVTLTVIPLLTPTKGAFVVQDQAVSECATGTHLNPGDVCTLCAVK